MVSTGVMKQFLYFRHDQGIFAILLKIPQINQRIKNDMDDISKGNSNICLF